MKNSLIIIQLTLSISINIISVNAHTSMNTLIHALICSDLSSFSHLLDTYITQCFPPSLFNLLHKDFTFQVTTRI